MVTKIGLDLGYANITISDIRSGIFREPSIALVHKAPQNGMPRIISVGSDALTRDSVGTNGEEGILVRPFKNGLLFDHALTNEIIQCALRSLKRSDKIRCVVGVPSDILPKQEKELFDMLAASGVETILSVSRPIAALVGAGYAPTISAISVNIGALSTEIAVLSKGQIVFSKRYQIGGEEFDKAVKQFIFEQGDVNISLAVARAIKERLGAVWEGRPNDSIDIEGTLSLTGNRLKMSVSTEDIVGVFEPPLRTLINAIIDALKKIPPDALEDVFSTGIILSGGGAELYGLDRLISKVLGVKVVLSESPIDCVAKGLAIINGFLPLKMKDNRKNITEKIASLYKGTKK